MAIPQKSIRELFVAMGRFIVEYRRPLILLVVIFISFIAIVNGGYFVASSNPKSCLVCHYMEPSYKTWEESAHKDVGCIECHPGRRTLIDSYMIKYITGTYHAKPQPDVKPDACLKCHTNESLASEITYKRGIKFNHEHHLGQMRRGKKLRCTSCHATNTDQGHFGVDNEACYLCHFKDADKGRAFSNCATCHGIPKELVEHQGFKLDHSLYVGSGVNCSSCHTSVATGNGDVSDRKCFECHSDQVAARSDVNSVHRIHITEHGIDCFKCHDRIDHGKVRMASTFELDCNKCHLPEHSQTVQMYIGSGARGIANEPSTMFLSQVSCEACHSGVVPAQSTWSEKRASCTTCHTKGYDAMADHWRKELGTMTDQVRGIRAKASSAGSPRASRDPIIATLLQNIDANYTLLVEGKAIHNPRYAMAIANQISIEADSIFARTGGGSASRPDLIANENNSCKLCHIPLGLKDGLAFDGKEFAHSVHVNGLELECNGCHIPARHPPKMIEKNKCLECHG